METDQSMLDLFFLRVLSENLCDHITEPTDARMTIRLSQEFLHLKIEWATLVSRFQ
jgi:hypothetical protein